MSYWLRRTMYRRKESWVIGEGDVKLIRFLVNDLKLACRVRDALNKHLSENERKRAGVARRRAEERAAMERYAALPMEEKLKYYNAEVLEAIAAHPDCEIIEEGDNVIVRWRKQQETENETDPRTVDEGSPSSG